MEIENTSAEIVYESRGKLIGGSLSRERTVEKSTIRNEGGDIYWWQRRDTRSNKKETDGIHGIRDPTRNCVNEYIVTGADTISNESETYSETVRITRFNERNISVCSKRLVWRCGAEIKRLLRTQKRLYPA